MFLLDLRQRLKRFSSDRSARRQHGERPATTLSREQRAERVRHLQDEVQRLQLELADASRPVPSDTASGNPTVIENRVRELEDELTRAQRTLATLQGRI